MSDIFQARYIEHQQRKRLVIQGPPCTGAVMLPEAQFDTLIAVRQSVRAFDACPVDPTHVDRLLNAVRLAPSSCNRQAVVVGVVTDAESIQALERMLVGGAGWLHRAPLVLLFFADPIAYKSPAEKVYMPYLDVGAACMQASLAARRHGLGTCWVNPNIHNDRLGPFHYRFNPDSLLLGSALACGYVNGATPIAPRRDLDQVVYYRR